jgi:hypothetical protein
VLNSSSEWILHTDEGLRIVPQELWDRVKARQRARSEDLGKLVRRGLNSASAKRAGRKPKYLFSGLLNCGTCGARFVIADRTHYACASRVNGGAAACTSDVRIKREIIESGLLAGIKNDLLAPDVMAEVRRHVHKTVRDNARTLPDVGSRLQVVEREVANLTDAIASGTLRACGSRRAPGSRRVGTCATTGGTAASKASQCGAFAAANSGAVPRPGRPP